MANILCGNCKQTHASAQDVRECYFDGFSSQEAMDAYHEAEAKAEQEAEARAERFWEEGTWQQQAQYQWEVEQDERNARFWSGDF